MCVCVCVCVVMQLASPFNLRKPFDLLSLMQQEERVSALRELKVELGEYRTLLDALDDPEGFFVASEPECKGVKPLYEHDLYFNPILEFHERGVR